MQLCDGLYREKTWQDTDYGWIAVVGEKLGTHDTKGYLIYFYLWY